MRKLICTLKIIHKASAILLKSDCTTVYQILGLNTLKPKKLYFADDCLKCNLLIDNYCILIKISLNFFPKALSDNNRWNRILRTLSIQMVWLVCFISLYSWGPFYQHGLTSIPEWISNHMPNKVWDEITYPFPNFNGGTVSHSCWSLGMVQ